MPNQKEESNGLVLRIGSRSSSKIYFDFYLLLKVKKEGKVWIATVAVGEQLYDYKYPFQFTDYFLTWKTIHQFQVKSQIENTFKKELHIEEFLKLFGKIANQT